MPKSQLIDAIMEYVQDAYFHTIPAKANVLSVLKALKEAGASLNILTASPHITLDPCLKRLGLWELFDNVWSCDDFSTTKADPQLYVMAAQRLHTTVGNILFLDDNLQVTTVARSVGMQTCGVYDASSGDSAEEIKAVTDYYICNFLELLDPNMGKKA